MIKAGLYRYINNFKGFSREVWILTIVTFINRAGTMVLPFLSKYLKEDLHFSYENVGWVMVCFGLGSMLGSWLGGKLSDSIGFYRVMVFSLFTSGLMLLAMQFITSFAGLCVGMFVLMTIADMFRPAMFVSLAAYAPPENRTRALTLVRLAVNLGFSAGPALGGLIIMSIGYKGLFWADGATCIASIVVFAILVKEKKSLKTRHDGEPVKATKALFADKIFWLFLLVSFITAMIFFQIFTTLPLYHRERYGLTELQTGLLMMLNGLLVFFFEMPIVSISERRQLRRIKIIFWGCVCMALSFVVLLPEGWAGLLIFSIILMSYGEMFIFPFSNAFALSRAPRGLEGRYMGYFTMTFSLAHIASSKIGMAMISNFGYVANWIFMAAMGVVSMGACLWILRLLRNEGAAVTPQNYTRV